jgi:excisionase family DNA binding protein
MSKITPEHVRRAAYIYVRQSTLQQLQNNHESRRRQYGLRSRAEALGWQEIVTIDEDLGRSGSGTARPGFDRLLSSVCQGTVGAVFSIEASRLARNGRDWHTLIEFCGLVNTLLIDEDGIYNPSHPNDRLLLGIKGTMSEMELATFRQRSQEALKSMAARGELFTSVAVGYLRTPDNRLEKDPNQRVQQSIEMVLQKFRELGSVRQVLLYFHEEKIELPAVGRAADRGRLLWRLPVYNTVHKILTNPVYAGAYVYGRTESRTRIEHERKAIRRGCPRAQSEWSVLLVEHHPGYLSWEEYQTNQALIGENANGKGAMIVRGSVKRGDALLAGLLRCGHCGRKLTVQYCGRQGSVGRYQCRGAMVNHGRIDNCISFGGLRVDEAVTKEVLRCLEPLGIEAAMEAVNRHQANVGAERQQRLLALEQARYEAERAHRQYDAIEPENRLVVAELERRWNDALKVVQVREEALTACIASSDAVEPPMRQQLLALADELPMVWNHPSSSVEIKKRILRVVLNEIVVYLKDQRLRLVLHWQGGDHTEIETIKNKPGMHRWKTDAEIAPLMQQLARVQPDKLIASLLNRAGKRTAKGLPWTSNRVCTFRGDHQIPVYKEGERQARNELTLEEAAAQLKVSTMTVRRLIKGGILPATQACVGAPWIIASKALNRTAVKKALREGLENVGNKQRTFDFQ